MREGESQKFYNVKILQIYVEYLKDVVGWTDVQVDELFRACGADRSILFSDDNWFDQRLANRFYQRMVEATGDSEVAYKVGVFAVSEKAKGVAGRIIGAFLNPKVAYSNIGRIAAMYSKGAILMPVLVSETRATIRADVAPGCDEQPFQCQNRLGMLETVPAFYGLPRAVTSHPKCVHRGDDYCEYHFEWRKPLSWVTLYVPPVAVCLTGFWLAVPQMGMMAATSVALGLAGVFFGLNTRYVHGRLKNAINDQFEALRILVNTNERRHREAMLSNKITGLITTTLKICDICGVAAKAIKDKMNYDRVAIFTVDRHKELWFNQI